jgi:predicted nucleotidyltransferase
MSSGQSDMREEWVVALRGWATSNDNVSQLWLFGSRAKGTARPNSDIDIAIEMMPADGKHNWALANYVEFFEIWKAELRDAVNWPVSLIAIGPSFDMDSEVRETGICLWRRT